MEKLKNGEVLKGAEVVPSNRDHIADCGESFPLMPMASGPATGAANTDNSHVTMLKPIDLKRRELAEAKQK